MIGRLDVKCTLPLFWEIWRVKENDDNNILILIIFDIFLFLSFDKFLTDNDPLRFVLFRKFSFDTSHKRVRPL